MAESIRLPNISSLSTHKSKLAKPFPHPTYDTVYQEFIVTVSFAIRDALAKIKPSTHFGSMYPSMYLVVDTIFKNYKYFF